MIPNSMLTILLRWLGQLAPVPAAAGSRVRLPGLPVVRREWGEAGQREPHLAAMPRGEVGRLAQLQRGKRTLPDGIVCHALVHLLCQRLEVAPMPAGRGRRNLEHLATGMLRAHQRVGALPGPELDGPSGADDV